MSGGNLGDAKCDPAEQKTGNEPEDNDRHGLRPQIGLTADSSATRAPYRTSAASATAPGPRPQKPLPDDVIGQIEARWSRKLGDAWKTATH
jgi:hypothetical protein